MIPFFSSENAGIARLALVSPSRRAPFAPSSFRRKTALPPFPQAAFGGECQIFAASASSSRSRGFASTPPCALRCTIARRSRVSGHRDAAPLASSKGALLVRVKACGVNPVDAKSSATNCPPSSDRWREGSSTAESPGSTQRRRRARPARERLRRRRRGVRAAPFRGPSPSSSAPLDQVAQARVADPRPSRAGPRGHRRTAPRSTSLRSRSPRSGHRCQRRGWPPAVQIAKARGAAVAAVCGVANEAFVRRLGATRSSPTMPSPGTPSPGMGTGMSPGIKTTA